MKDKRKMKSSNYSKKSAENIANIARELSFNEDYTNDTINDTCNIRDDGDQLMDSSINDFMKGYNIDPYEFQQWAKQHGKKLVKNAMNEVYIMKYSPEFLADRMLTLWNGADGPLQNFFEAFTLRYNNTLKEQVANELAKMGYTVYPMLFDDKPRYARLNKVMRKVASTNNLDNILEFSNITCNSDPLHLFAGELADLREAGQPVSLEEAAGILGYYRALFPEDYAIALVSGLMNGARNLRNVPINRFYDRDFDFSDEALDKIEDYMSGNATPWYTNNGGSDGWDFVRDERSFDGVRPVTYEVTPMTQADSHSRLKKFAGDSKKKLMK